MCCYFWFDFCRYDLLRGLLCHKLRRCRVDVHESKQRTLTFLTHKTLLCTRALTAANKVDSNFLAAKLLGETRAVAARAWVARSCDVQARDATRAGFGRVPYLTQQSGAAWHWHFGLELGLPEAKGTATGTSGRESKGSEFLRPSS